MKTSHPRKQAGATIVAAMITLAVVSGMVGVMLLSTSQRSTLAQRDRKWQQANAAAESALEYAFATWKKWVQDNGGTIPLAANLAGQTYNGRGPLTLTTSSIQTHLNNTLKFDGVTLESISISALDNTERPIASNTSMTVAEQQTAMRTLLPVPSLPKRTGRTYTYRATARVTLAARGQAGNVDVTVQRYFQKTDASIWQAMMFYDGDLELFPTPDMPLYGWIHTNSNAYICHANNSFNMTLNSDFTISGSPSTISKGLGSTVQDPRGLIYGVSYLQQMNETYWSSWKEPVWAAGGLANQLSYMPNRLDPFAEPRETLINTTDSSANNDSLREIIERPVDTNADSRRTAADDAAGFKDRRYYNVADIKIIVNRAATNVNDRIKILDKNDTRITDTFATNLVTQALGKNATTGLPSTKDFYDYREAGNVTSASASAAQSTTGKVTVTNLDVSKLTPLLNSYSGYTNGVIYFKDETPANTTGVNNKKAVRLVKGGVLPNIGMSIATEDGAYVQGDFNTGSTYNSTTGALVSQPNSNATTGANPLSNAVSGYTVKPASILADAVTFLSNAWQDTYSYSTATNSRVGLPTTYNTAFMSGHVGTNTGYESGANTTNVRSGGGINFPRVLENWNSQALTYHGSMVQMFESQVFNKGWVNHIYGAPKRPWNFDPQFLNNPPPGPLEFTIYSRGRFARPQS